MKNQFVGVASLAIIVSLLSGCKSAEQHRENIGSGPVDRNLTVGVVQKEIRVGMSQADVAVSLGSPNIVTRDNSGKETWVYDKIATEASYSSSQGGVGLAAGGGGLMGASKKALLLGGVGADYSESSGAASTTQKTLTVVIKFDPAQKVENFTYHTSKF